LHFLDTFKTFVAPSDPDVTAAMVPEGRTLWLWNTLPKKGLKAEDQTWKKEGDAVENVHRLKLANYGKSSFGSACSGVQPPHTVQHNVDVLGNIVDLVKPGAIISVVQVVGGAKLPPSSQLVTDMKLAGMTDVGTPEVVAVDQDTLDDIRDHFGVDPQDTSIQVVRVTGVKPNFETGSSQRLSFAKKVEEKKAAGATAAKKAVWSLDDDEEDEDVELVDPDTLIDEEDLKKPDAASLRVCGTTGKRKACKDCSCGLAEELADGKEPTKKTVNSSCGSCYLGDAFRCASCPYLGMPAFKAGEKIQLSERQLKADQ